MRRKTLQYPLIISVIMAILFIALTFIQPHTISWFWYLLFTVLQITVILLQIKTITILYQEYRAAVKDWEISCYPCVISLISNYTEAIIYIIALMKSDGINPNRAGPFLYDYEKS